MQSQSHLVIFHEFVHVGGGQTFVTSLYSVLKPALKKVNLIVGAVALQKWFQTYSKTQPVLLVNVYTPRHLLQLLWCVVRGSKLIVVVHGIWYREWQSRLGRSSWLGWQTWKLFIAQGILLFMADELVALSRYSLDLIQSSFPFGKHLSSKISIIPGMLTEERLPVSVHQNSVLLPVNGQPQKNIFLAVGRLERRKGFELLIKAFGTLAKKSKSAYLILALDLGSTSQVELMSNIANQIHNSGCFENIRLLVNPPKDYLRKQLAVADAYVLPSTELETFGFVTVEALQAGLPVIGFATGATPEVLGPDLARMLLAKKTTPKALAKKMAMWIELTSKQKQKIRKMVFQRAKRFEAVVMAKSWLNLLGKYG